VKEKVSCAGCYAGVKVKEKHAREGLLCPKCAAKAKTGAA
jgi:hypothetical protein